LTPAPLERVLVSACLLGEAVRHNAQDKRSDHPVLRRWIAEGRVVRVCPEVAGGLPVPRPAAEIEGGAGGRRVLLGEARVVDRNGNDVTAPFVKGAQAALDLVEAHGIRVAVLKARSPSCGSSESYDGTFGGGLVEEPGVTAALLMSHGILVFSEEELEAADEALRALP
jgi:uncharacterized protein YbbK (DUF523 family)